MNCTTLILGLLCGVAAGGTLALVYAVACIRFQADQVVAGMGINILMVGLAGVDQRFGV